jgi:hypothetical protein
MEKKAFDCPRLLLLPGQAMPQAVFVNNKLIIPGIVLLRLFVFARSLADSPNKHGDRQGSDERYKFAQPDYRLNVLSFRHADSGICIACQQRHSTHGERHKNQGTHVCFHAEFPFLIIF